MAVQYLLLADSSSPQHFTQATYQLRGCDSLWLQGDDMAVRFTLWTELDSKYANSSMLLILGARC